MEIGCCVFRGQGTKWKMEDVRWVLKEKYSIMTSTINNICEVAVEALPNYLQLIDYRTKDIVSLVTFVKRPLYS